MNKTVLKHIIVALITLGFSYYAKYKGMEVASIMCFISFILNWVAILTSWTKEKSWKTEN